MPKFIMAIQARQHGNSNGEWVERSRLTFAKKKEASETLAVLRKLNQTTQYRGVVLDLNSKATGEVLGTEATAEKVPKKGKLTRAEILRSAKANGLDTEKLQGIFREIDVSRENKKIDSIVARAEARGIDPGELVALEKARLAEHRAWMDSLEQVSRLHREQRVIKPGVYRVERSTPRLYKAPETIISSSPNPTAERDARRLYSGSAAHLDRSKPGVRTFARQRVKDSSGPIKEYMPGYHIERR